MSDTEVKRHSAVYQLVAYPEPEMIVSQQQPPSQNNFVFGGYSADLKKKLVNKAKPPVFVV